MSFAASCTGGARVDGRLDGAKDGSVVVKLLDGAALRSIDTVKVSASGKYACRVPVPENGFVWDQEEVNDVGIFPFHVFRAQVMDHNDEAFGNALDRIEATL